MPEANKSDELEVQALQKIVSDLERQVNLAPGPKVFLAATLENVQARLESLQKKIKDKENDGLVEVSANVFAAWKREAVEREKALSESEKEIYESFLEKQFFTKKDFKALDQFYSQTWDRLSQHGRNQMDLRLWEGIRRNEYTFAELPKSVQEKASESAYARLREGPREMEPKVPEKDRGDFLKAYENGQKDDAYKVLGRRSFKENMSRVIRDAQLREPSTNLGTNPSNPAQVDPAVDADHEKMLQRLRELDTSSIDLKGVKSGDSTAVAPKEVARTEKDPASVQR